MGFIIEFKLLQSAKRSIRIRWFTFEYEVHMFPWELISVDPLFDAKVSQCSLDLSEVWWNVRWKFGIFNLLRDHWSGAFQKEKGYHWSDIRSANSQDQNATSLWAACFLQLLMIGFRLNEIHLLRWINTRITRGMPVNEELIKSPFPFIQLVSWCEEGSIAWSSSHIGFLVGLWFYASNSY